METFNDYFIEIAQETILTEFEKIAVFDKKNDNITRGK